MIWWNCVRSSTFGLDAFRPMYDQRIARTAEMGRDLLGPFERRVSRPRPPDRNMRLGRGAADLVEFFFKPLETELDAIEARDLVDGAFKATLGRRAIVADDVEDQRVVELARLLDRRDKAADLLIGVIKEAGIVLHQPAVDALGVFRLRIPSRDFGRARRQLRICRDHAKPLLPLECLLAIFVPARRQTCPCISRDRPPVHDAGRGWRRWRNR